MRYKLRSHKSFRKEIIKLPKRRQVEVYQVLKSLSNSPTKLPVNSKALQGHKGIYRVRFGNYRLIFQVDHEKETIWVLVIGSRGEVYKMMRRLLG